jgi:cellulose synthase/poly-beta-1,6-N-acetylglucosamine synthase-like glycosyltransferase
MALPSWVGTFSFFYVVGYQALTLVYLWYRYLLLFYVELRSSDDKATAYQDEAFSIIIPFYNEKPALLRRTLESLRDAKGNKQIIIVDDGSPDRSAYEMAQAEFPEMLLCRYEDNRGKRQAQKEGFRHATGEYIITIDSDTVLDPDAIINLLDPLLRDHRVGATTGDVKVLNRYENFLTRMIAARYWNAFSVERKALSGFGIVTCCSGVLSAYRYRFLAEHMEEYTHQTFLGEECTYGDDRHLTNLLLKDGWKIHFVQNAVCYTEVPTTYRQFFTQQLRWKKSFIRESIITLRFAFRHGFLLPFEVLMNLLIPLWSLALRIILIASIILNPVLILPFVASVITVALIRNYFLFWEDRALLFYSIPYAFIHEFGLFWLYFIAAFKLKQKGWGTR